MHAEQAYLFRHALLRDAAYGMQMPGDRAALHLLAADLMEQLLTGPFQDAAAVEIADHIRGARLHMREPALAARELGWASKAAGVCEGRYRYFEACTLQQRCAELAQGPAAWMHWCKAASCANAAERPDLAHSFLERVFAAAGDDADVRVQALSVRASVHYNAGRLAQSEADYRQALGLIDVTDRRIIYGTTLRNLSIVLLQAGRMPEAEQAQLRALELLAEAPDPREALRARSHLALTYQITGRFEQAETLLREVLAQWRALGDDRMLASDTGNLASLYVRTQRLLEAEREYLKALDMERRLGARRSEGVTLTNLANVYLNTDRHELAARACHEALGIHRELGNLHGEGVALGHMAFAHAAAARYAEADAGYRRSLEVLRQVGDRRFQGAFHCMHALPLVASGRIHEARASWHAGATLLMEVGDRPQLELQRASMRQACARAGVPPFDEPESK